MRLLYSLLISTVIISFPSKAQAVSVDKCLNKLNEEVKESNGSVFSEHEANSGKYELVNGNLSRSYSWKCSVRYTQGDKEFVMLQPISYKGLYAIFGKPYSEVIITKETVNRASIAKKEKAREVAYQKKNAANLPNQKNIVEK